MKRERSEKKSKAVSKMPCIEATVNNKCQWYEVLLELHLKSTQESSFVSFRHGWKEHLKDWFRLTGAINKSDNRRELPTIPQPTHTMEWLARTSFKHRPLRHNIVPQQRKHKTPKRHTQHDHSKFVY